ncbi:hypothetical protein BU24DRAFT_453847 [Aaosphaeria arxii CBS 175.79]|uniref:Peroxin 11C n=1 Tax=Aaosphaeria arxii CBS 175.79 TaxID=1450172 RepID=A0A6A5XE13_9PLEO|nr:uncharacterized protein BU24DRAFT_453847 [Aaosphaeria arxii CBS 175.79]KAF2011258.1 hypothetical protein BU24DRAFT_453847 [Aaosphaeria arxii CBS 175.79]
MADAGEPQAPQPPASTSTTTIPSTEQPQPQPPTKSPQPSQAPPSPPSKPHLLNLRLALLRLIYRLAHSTDTTLLRISALLSTPSGIDSTLCTISYTLTLLRALLTRVLEARLTTLATSLASKADAVLLPGETLIATLPAPPTTKALAHLVATSKALNDTISDYRIFVRLWGLAGIYTWARATLLAPAPKDRREKVLRAVEWGEIVASVGFQVLENGAYLSSKGALTTSGWAGDEGKRREARWWVWSSRFWAAQVSLEFVRLFVKWLYFEGELGVKGGEGVDDGEKEGKIRGEERERVWREEKQLWWRDLVNNMAYFPMTMHWSSETGLLSDAVVGFCGIFAGGVMLRHRWKATA